MDSDQLSQDISRNYNQSGITGAVNAFSSDFKLTGSCKAFGDTTTHSNCCGVCHLNGEVNSAICSAGSTVTSSSSAVRSPRGTCTSFGGLQTHATCSTNGFESPQFGSTVGQGHVSISHSWQPSSTLFLSLPSVQPVADFPTGNRVQRKPSCQPSCVRSRNYTGNHLLNRQANHRRNQLQIRASSHDRQSLHSRLTNQIVYHHHNQLRHHPQRRVCNHLLSRRHSQSPIQSRSHHSNVLHIQGSSRLRSHRQHRVNIHRCNHLLSRLTRSRRRHRNRLCSLLRNPASNRASSRPCIYRISRLLNHPFNRLRIQASSHPFNRRICRRR